MDPFDENSPIKQAAIEKFPPDMFFVLRVVQLLRGMANGKQRTGMFDACTAARHCSYGTKLNKAGQQTLRVINAVSNT